jgi:phage/plasmid-like protein (TIGR03299 family)
MSAETMQDLNQNTLIGFTAKRGNAWHYRADLQGDQPNHYVGAIPVEDVLSRLFHWTALETEISHTVLTADGVTKIVDQERKGIMRSDTLKPFAVFKKGYQIHQHSEWLVDNVANLLDADLHIGSAGLLRGGGVAWVQIEMEETMSAAGLDFRPFFTAAGSLDGTLATTYQEGNQAVVCDNTLAAAMTEDSLRVKIRHSKNSLGRIQEVRDALGIVHSIGDDFARHVEKLAAEKVSDRRFQLWTAAFAGLTDEKLSKRSKSIAETKSEQLIQLWNHDERVNPWKGTALGVLQAANTWTHHLSTVRGATRAERNAERVVLGKIAEVDANALKILASV